jgi:hypothetical protein
VPLTPEYAAVLAAVAQARHSTGSLAPHLYSICQHIPPRQGMYGAIEMGAMSVRDVLVGLDREGFVARQGRALEFALTEAGQEVLDEIAART